MCPWVPVSRRWHLYPWWCFPKKLLFDFRCSEWQDWIDSVYSIEGDIRSVWQGRAKVCHYFSKIRPFVDLARWNTEQLRDYRSHYLRSGLCLYLCLEFRARWSAKSTLGEIHKAYLGLHIWLNSSPLL